MVKNFNPQDIFEEMKSNFSSIDMFDNLVKSSALYYQEHGSLDTLKLFIPNSKNNADYLHNWTPEKADLTANQIIFTFTEQRISNAYLKEHKDNGIYLAFKTETSVFLSFAQYIGEASYILSKAKNNGINITADEWLRDFPYEVYSAWYNRNAISEEMSILISEPGNELLVQGIFDGKQNWLENYKSNEIENWNPQEKFIEVFHWVDNEDEIQRLIKDFRKNYN